MSCYSSSALAGLAYPSPASLGVRALECGFFAACQAALLGILLAVHILIAIGENLVRVTTTSSWEKAAARNVRFGDDDDDAPGTPPPLRFSGRDIMPRKHPSSSVGMGRFFKV